MGFQVFFKRKCPIFLVERQICNQFQWLVFRCMGRLTMVVGLKTGFEIFGISDVCLIGVWYTAEEIYVIHDAFCDYLEDLIFRLRSNFVLSNFAGKTAKCSLYGDVSPASFYRTSVFALSSYAGQASRSSWRIIQAGNGKSKMKLPAASCGVSERNCAVA